MSLFARTLRPLTVALFAMTVTASSLAADLGDELRLNTAITVTGDAVHLGDIFTGYLSRPEKVVTQSPRPGQRLVLTADWLRELARKQGLDWQPANVYDRAVVYQPGQTISPQEIAAAAKAELIKKGMPADYSIAAAAPREGVTVSMAIAADIGVREAYFDPASHAFTAVVEIPPGDPKAQFVPLRGVAYAAVTVPALKESVPKNTMITAAMLTTVELPAAQVKGSMITDASYLVGKSPKVFLKSGTPVFETEVAQVTLVDVPVLTMDLDRDDTIAKNQVAHVTLNAAELPRDVVTEASQLVGRSPRRILVAGAPIRRGDVQMVREVRVPVAARDMPRGAMLSDADLNWVTMNDAELVGNVITDPDEIIGRATKHAVRAGQSLHAFDIARPTAVPRGKLVTILYDVPMIKLTARGQALEAGGVGDIIRIMNTKSNTTVTAEIIDAQTVRIASQQTAMR